MSTITINRNDAASIPFSISDSSSGLAGKRVTWSVARSSGGPPVLRKVSGLPGSSADITITTQTAASIVGIINLTLADFAVLPPGTYYASLWIDSGASDDRCTTSGGEDTLVVDTNVPRTAP